MGVVDSIELTKEHVFMEAWERGFVPALSGITRIRQFIRAEQGRQEARDVRQVRIPGAMIGWSR